jgi:hypothetical protein
VGEIGFPRREFLYEVSFWEIRRIIKGYRMRQRTFCDMMRWQTWYLLQPHVKPNTIKTPSDLATFPLWEKEEEAEYNENDVNEMRELIRKKNEEAGLL